MKIFDKTTQTYKELVLKPSGDTLPIGGIIAFDSDTIPKGWLLCDGRAVSRTEYAELFKAIGTKHGSGDGSTTFNLPNLKGRTLVGKNSSDTDFSELGKIGGEKTHTLTTSEIPSHSHHITSVGIGSGNYGYNISSLSIGSEQKEYTDNTGGGQPHNNLQPYLVTNFIIKAKMTVAIEGEIIQEDGTASETNVYSSVAMDNKLKTSIVTGQEFATNEYIDGKRVYVKRISTGSLPNATTTSVATGLNFSEIDIQKVNGMATRIKGGEKTSLPIPNNGVEVWLSGNNLNINCTINRSEFSGYVNIYYTKNA